MRRIHFVLHRELLGPLCRAAYETVKQPIVAAGEEKRSRTNFFRHLFVF
jgi:hypothetical protein